MSHFIKKSLEELEHVVWPTNAESKKYMLYTVGTIVIMATILAVVGYAIRTGLAGVRQSFDHPTPVTTETSSGSEFATQEDLKNLLQGAGSGAVEVTTASGTPASVEVAPGTGN